MENVSYIHIHHDTIKNFSLKVYFDSKFKQIHQYHSSHEDARQRREKEQKNVIPYDSQSNADMFGRKERNRSHEKYPEKIGSKWFGIILEQLVLFKYSQYGHAAEFSKIIQDKVSNSKGERDTRLLLQVPGQCELGMAHDKASLHKSDRKKPDNFIRKSGDENEIHS